MFIQPYNTTICRHYKTDKIKNAVERAAIEHPFTALTTGVGNVIKDTAIVTPNDVYDEVPNFTQFITIGNADKPTLVIDTRPYMSWDRRSDSYRLTAENDFNFQCTRLALTQCLQEDGSTPFFRLGDVPVKTFIRWITLAISQRYSLALEHQINLSVICGYYYYTQFNKLRKLDAEEIQLYSKHIARITSIPASTVLEIGEKLGNLSNAEDLAEQIAINSGSVRLNKLKFVDLYTIIAGSWVGVNARENVGVALEHMPTFIAMVYSGLDERSYRKTVITSRAETAGRSADQKQFVDQVYRMVSTRFI